MGQELVMHLLDDPAYDLVAWNRTPGKAMLLEAQGAVLAATASDAVRHADIVVTCLFGPEAVRQVVLDADLPWRTGALWIEVSTVGPAVARDCDAWTTSREVRYVQAPVLGSLGPARAGALGVLIGGTDAAARAATRRVSSHWADPERVVEYDEPGKAAAGKLLVNYGLAVGMQGLIEACRVGEAGGLTPQEAVSLAGLPKTPLATIAGMKGAALLAGDYSDTQFSANLLAKDVNLMLATADGQSLPALMAAATSLGLVCQSGDGELDFSAMAGV